MRRRHRPVIDRRSPFNFALNGGRFALPVDGPCATKERDMIRLIAWVIRGALLTGSVGLMMQTRNRPPDPHSLRETALSPQSRCWGNCNRTDGQTSPSPATAG